MKKKIVLTFLATAGFILCCAGCFLLGVYRGEGSKTLPLETVYVPDTEYEGIPEDVLASIVEIDVFNERDEKIANASGFIAFEPRYLVTCRHALVNMKYAVCTTETGETFRIDDICQEDEDLDIAICILPKECKLKALKIATTPLKRGESVTAVGSQFGIVNVVTRGNASMIKNSYILFTAFVNSGSSGGVLLNSSYEVCGVIRGTYEGQGINVAIPIDLVSKAALQ